MAEKDKKLIDGKKLYLDEDMKGAVQKGGGDGETVRVLQNRFSFLVFSPDTDYEDLKGSLKTLLKDVESEIEHQKRKNGKTEENQN